jgi:hypothetical protein
MKDITEEIRQQAAAKKAAEQQRREESRPPEDKTTGKAIDFEPLDSRRIKLENPPRKPVSVFTLAEQQVSTAGNLTAITAQAKAGKSATVGAMLASAVVNADERESADCLGFQAHPHNGKAVILFDTEQSPYDSHRQVERAAKRAEVKDFPPNFRMYRLLDVSTGERRRFLASEMERASNECGAVHSVLIDGVADLCVDPNNSEEAFGLVEQLVQLAVKYECPIVLVLHENPASNGQQVGKTRGHLGSQLERKAESNLRVIKEGEISTIFSDKCRSANIPKDRGVCFEWSDAHGMHITIANKAGEKKEAKQKNEHMPAVQAVFEGHVGAMPWKILMKRLESEAGLKGKTRDRRITAWQELGLIAKTEVGYMRL